MQSIDQRNSDPNERDALVEGENLEKLKVKETRNEGACRNRWTNITSLWSNETLSKVWAAYFLIIGLWTVLAPESIGSAYGLDGFDDDLLMFLVSFMGFMVTSVGTTALVTLIHNEAHNLHAIAVGMLVRGFCFLYHSLSNGLSVKVVYMAVMGAIHVACSIPLLLKKRRALAVARITTVVLCLLAIYLYIDPVGASMAEFGIGIGQEGMERIKFFVQDYAMEDFLSAFFLALLAFGASPIKAMGMASLVYPAYIIDIWFISKISGVMGFSTGALVQTFCVPLLFALKFLLTGTA